VDEEVEGREEAGAFLFRVYGTGEEGLAHNVGLDAGEGDFFDEASGEVGLAAAGEAADEDEDGPGGRWREVGEGGLEDGEVGGHGGVMMHLCFEGAVEWV